MKSNVSIDIQRMFEQACSFADCAHFCETDSWYKENSSSKYLNPYVVNSAFSIEIFIKSLLVYKGETFNDLHKHGHAILTLWNELKKKDIMMADNIQSRAMFAFDSKDDPFFDDAINSISDSFEKWRYVYEFPEEVIYVNFPKLLREVLREICCETFFGIDWDEYKVKESWPN